MSGVTVRTLHHYEQVGLLEPSARSAAGYRLYSRDDLFRLQQILMWRELGFALEQIRNILDDPGFDRRHALVKQRQELLRRVEQSNAMIRSIDLAIETLKGDEKMNAKELFDGFDHSQYEDEAKQRWGDTAAYRESARRTKKYSERDWLRIKTEGNSILDGLAEKMKAGATAAQDDVVVLAEQHRLHIDRWFYPCTHEHHQALADMYLADERFASNIDKHGDGLTQFLADAIHENASRAPGGD